MSNATPPGVAVTQTASPLTNARAQNLGADVELAADRIDQWVTVLRLDARDVPSAGEVCTVYVRAVAKDGEPMDNLRGRVTWGAGGSRGGHLLFDLGQLGAAFSVPTAAITVDVRREQSEEARDARVSAFIARGNHPGELNYSTPFEGDATIAIPPGAVRVTAWTVDGTATTLQYLNAAGDVVGQVQLESGASSGNHIPTQARSVRNTTAERTGTFQFRLLH